MSRAIRRKLMEAEYQPSLIEQWCKRAIALDRNCRESKREEERLREKKENRDLAPRMNNQETQQQILPRPQVWPRRQETSQQWVPTGLVPMEGVKRIMEAIVCP